MSTTTLRQTNDDRLGEQLLANVAEMLAAAASISHERCFWTSNCATERERYNALHRLASAPSTASHSSRFKHVLPRLKSRSSVRVRSAESQPRSALGWPHATQMHSMPYIAVHPSGKFFVGQSQDNQLLCFTAVGKYKLKRVSPYSEKTDVALFVRQDIMMC